MKTPEKPDFDSSTFQKHERIWSLGERLVFVRGCERIWNEYVIPASSQIEELTKEVENAQESVDLWIDKCSSLKKENDRYREALEAIRSLASNAPPFRKDLILANSKIYNTTSSALHPLVKEGEK